MQTINTSKLTRRDFLGTGLGVAGSIILTGCASTSDTDDSTTTINRVNITLDGKGKRVITSNSYPKHPTGEFPNPACPYGKGSEMFRFEMNAIPKTQNPTGSIYTRYHRFGVALNGVTFDPAGPAWDGNNTWHVEVLSFIASRHLGIDGNNAHVQPYDRPGGASEPKGEYHYHGFPAGLFNLLFKEDMQQSNNPKKTMFLLGYAADGFPIYAPQSPIDPNDPNSQIVTLHASYTLRHGQREDIAGQGKRPAGNYDGTFVEDYIYDNTIASQGDEYLDEFNGRYGITPEYPNGTYYYVITKTFPFVPRAFKGEVLDNPPPLTADNMNFVHPRPPGEAQIPDALKNYPAA